MAEKANAPVCFFGTTPECHLWTNEVHSLGLSGTTATFHYGGQQAEVHLQLLGAHSVYTAGAALAVAVHFGVPFEQAAQDLETLPPGPRLNLLDGISRSQLIDDSYNASPPSVIAALDFLATLDG